MSPMGRWVRCSSKDVKELAWLLCWCRTCSASLSFSTSLLSFCPFPETTNTLVSKNCHNQILPSVMLLPDVTTVVQRSVLCNALLCVLRVYHWGDHSLSYTGSSCRGPQGQFLHGLITRNNYISPDQADCSLFWGHCNSWNGSCFLLHTACLKAQIHIYSLPLASG